MIAKDLKNSDNISPKKWWKIAKTFLKSTKKTSYPPLYHGNADITDNKEKAKKFNDFFLSHSDIDEQNVELPIYNEPDGPLNLIHVTQDDVKDQINCIDPSKASGPDGIGSKMLKLAGDSIVPSLTRLFNLSLTSHQYPTPWKKANVTPIFKKDDPSDVNNYRPISLLSCLSKLFEKIVFKYLFNFLRDNNKISLKQSGFMPGDSTVYQLVHLYHLFCEALDNKKDIRITFCDISKAFDRVWHKGLLFKLKKTGISGPLLNWFESYLSERQQRVAVSGEFSEWGQIKAGVPQGSVLGPLLFLIYINDITEVVQSEVRLFADDTILHVFVDNPVTSAEALNSDLEQIDRWAKQWIIRFSPPKTESLTISRKKTKQPSPPLYFDGTQIKEVPSHKHLGIILTDDLNWNEHITQITNSAGKCVDVLNALKYKLDCKTLEKLYLSFVRSKLEYGNIIWDNCTQDQIDMLENVQLRAAKIVSGAIRRTHTELLYKELGWETLQERRAKQRLTTMFKIFNNNAPTYLTSTLPNTVAENNQYNLRNRDNFATYKARTKTFQLSFFPRTVNEWNHLPPDIRNSDTASTFRGKLPPKAEAPPVWYCTGERKIAVVHAKLRMLCSPINDHLYSHIHVIDSPQCHSGSTCENNRHFLLECPLYLIERRQMMSDLLALNFPVSLNSLLFGNSKLSEAKNIAAFEIIHKFLSDTGRFE